MGQIKKRGNKVVVTMKFDELIEKKAYFKLPNEPKPEGGMAWMHTISGIINYTVFELIKEHTPDLALKTYNAVKIYSKDDVVHIEYSEEL